MFSSTFVSALSAVTLFFSVAEHSTGCNNVSVVADCWVKGEFEMSEAFFLVSVSLLTGSGVGVVSFLVGLEG